MKIKLILTSLFAAASVWAQSEQWLEYRTETDATSYRSYQIATLTTNAPAGVALPKFMASPYFVFWKTPMEPAGGRWLAFDRSRKSGPYDLVFVDTTGNGRLDDKTPAKARLDSYYAYFPPTALVFKGEDGPVTYHLGLRFYQYENNPAQLLVSSAGWYEGAVNFGGAKKQIKLIDGNVNGTFNDISENAYAGDRVEIDGDGVGEHYLGKLIEVDGKFFHMEAARDGAFVKVQPAENVVLGSVHVPENISEFAVFGENGHFVRKPASGQFTLPIGKYQIPHWQINRKDDKGTPWTLSGQSFPKEAGFEVAADKTVTVDVGEPVHTVLKFNEQPNRMIRFDLSLLGKQNETIQLLRDGQRPKGPRLMLATASGTLAYTNSFEFG